MERLFTVSQVGCGKWGGDSSHYLEQVVEYGHLQPGQTKVSAIKQYPVPTTKKTGFEKGVGVVMEKTLHVDVFERRSFFLPCGANCKHRTSPLLQAVNATDESNGRSNVFKDAVQKKKKLHNVEEKLPLVDYCEWELFTLHVCLIFMRDKNVDLAPTTFPMVPCAVGATRCFRPLTLCPTEMCFLNADESPQPRTPRVALGDEEDDVSV
ncbi:hypothetical protein F2P81_025105 [Scophthalmus maximus]|uniref:Uncharacterized protein n=1 Tax=Scophthalmus maximus TaxID=52904 RepID=A0A6A4RLI0_SCOMX|nr:hypothetical protein F2P81_025105 [Scophthalmus maximus]